LKRGFESVAVDWAAAGIFACNVDIGVGPWAKHWHGQNRYGNHAIYRCRGAASTETCKFWAGND